MNASASRPCITHGLVHDSAEIRAGYWRVSLRVDAFPDARPGQFVNVLCRDADGAAHDSGNLSPSTGPLLRRPFSIADLRRAASTCVIDVLFRVVGAGTQWLAARKTGDRVSIIGPLGRPFVVEHDVRRALLVGGGMGVPPLLWLARTLPASGLSVVLVYGARSANVIPMQIDRRASRRGPSPSADLCVRELADVGVPTVVCTEDGSLGRPGVVTEALAAMLQQEGDVGHACVFTCGPEAMMRQVAAICAERRIRCQACLERMMACGMGTCQSCVVKVRDQSVPGAWHYRLCCTDGPVFDAESVLW